MNVRLGVCVVATSALAVAAFAPAATARSASYGAQPTITQTYTCHTPIGDVDLTSTVTGKAKIKGKTVSLKKVVYAVQNTSGFDFVVDHVKISTPDPGAQAAVYKSGTAKTAKKPKGWKAGHDDSGLFASYAKSMTIANGDSVTNAALSAKYKVTGGSGTEIDFQPGPVTFHVSSPVTGNVSCTPDAPVGTFASVVIR